MKQVVKEYANSCEIKNGRSRVVYAIEKINNDLTDNEELSIYLLAYHGDEDEFITVVYNIEESKKKILVE